MPLDLFQPQPNRSNLCPGNVARSLINANSKESVDSTLSNPGTTMPLLPIGISGAYVRPEVATAWHGSMPCSTNEFCAPKVKPTKCATPV